ncbi:MAG: GNAT family N-acetyltransferase [Planctomycetota bacterium]|nr:GNAT family N-acetyltransferase [Planctomycetota bacterium]
MNVRRAWRRITTWALILGAVAAILTTPGVFPLPRSAPETPIPAPGSADLATSIGAWQQATDADRAAYVAWLVRAGLDERHEAVSAWFRARAEDRQELSSDLLQQIFLILAGLSLLLIALPLFVKPDRAPRRRALWFHAVVGAGILFFTFLFLSIGLTFLLEITTDLSQLATPEAGLVDAAFDRIETEAEAALARDAAADALPYGPLIGAGDQGYDGGFLANLWRNLQYFDAEAFRPAVVWSQRAWSLLGLMPYVIPFLIALVFLLTMRPTLGRLLRMPLQAGRGEPRSGRRALKEALVFVGREWLAILVLTLILVFVSLLLHLGVRHLSHSLIRLALDETRTTIDYFGHLTTPAEQPRFSIVILALPMFLVVATLATAGGLGLFALWARRVTQLRYHQGIPLRGHDRFWRRGLFAVLQLQWIPMLLLWVLATPLAKLHASPIANAPDALGRLTTTAWVIGLGLLIAFPLFGGIRGLLYLLRFRPSREGGREVDYELRPSTDEDHDFLRRAHHAGLQPWITAVFGWDPEEQERLMDDWLQRVQPDIVTIGGKDAGYLLVRDDGDVITGLAVVLLPRYQRRGVGTRLVQGVIDRATAEGKPVVIRVLRGNPAKRLYERLGFEAFEETETHIRMRRPLDDEH